VSVIGENLDVAIVGDVIEARMRGDVTKEMLGQRHRHVLQISEETRCKKLLLDDLEMNPFSYRLLEAQRVLTAELVALNFKIAIVVPDSRLAYFARLQFGGKNHRVFYTDIAEAIRWLHESC
jgi:hypothetical protein